MVLPRAVWLTAVAAIVAVTVLPYWAPMRTAGLTAALVAELLDLPFRPLSENVAAPIRHTVSYGQPADRLDIYAPHNSGAAVSPSSTRAAPGLPAVVLALGVHPQPVDHPDIVRVATAISRLGVVVGVPDSTALRNLEVTPAEPAHLVDAALVLRDWPGVNPARVGLAGFSAGASIALIAATDQRIAPELRFVSAFGGYADAGLLLVDVATRTAIIDASERAWAPDPGIRRDVLELMLATQPDGAPTHDLRAMLIPYVTAETAPTGPNRAELAKLDGDARAIYLLFTAPDRAAATEAIASLSDGLQEELAAISPRSVVERIRAPVFLLHGEPDTAIPVGHAELLAAQLGDNVARFTRFGEFGHGDPAQQELGPDDAADIWELYLYLRDIVSAAVE